MPDVIIKGVEMRYACSGETDCFALDEHGDYPMCRITRETRGYTFPIRERRMDNCPLSPAPEREQPIKTNAGRIRAMADEELAEFIGGIYTLERDVWGDYDPCVVVESEKIRDKEEMLEWLQSPAGGDRDE